jgi:hypothetical protein
MEGHSSIWSEVRFLIDTGAGMTCLHPRDAFAAGIPRRSLLRRQAWSTPPVHMSGVGGTTEYFETPCSYAFPTATGDLHIIDRKLLVAKATQTNIALPALLGWDILTDFPTCRFDRTQASSSSILSSPTSCTYLARCKRVNARLRVRRQRLAM